LKQESETSLKKYKKACEEDKKTILFVVFRGKYTEGQNFPGKLCRAIFIIGIPYLNI